MADIKKVGILGGGMMGSDIALTCAIAGYEVIMKEINMELAEAGYRKIKSSLKKWMEKGRIEISDEQKKKALEAIRPTDSFEGFEDVDLVIEAVFESEEVKNENFKALEKICKPSCIIASNTSSISITKLLINFK